MTDFSKQSMIFIPSSTPYIEIESGENADLYHYHYQKMATDKNRVLKPNYEAFGEEIARRWNRFPVLEERVRFENIRSMIITIYAVVITLLLMYVSWKG